MGWLYDQAGMRHHEGYLGKVLEDGSICASYGGEPGSPGTRPHVAARACCDCGWQGSSEYRAPEGTLWTGLEHEVHEEHARAEWAEHVRAAPRKYLDVPRWEVEELIERLALHELSEPNLRHLEFAIHAELERRGDATPFRHRQQR